MTHPVERALQPLAAPELRDVREVEAGDVPAPGVSGLVGPEPGWLHAGDWRVFSRPADTVGLPGGHVLASFSLASGRSLPVVHDPDRGAVVVPFGFADAFDGYVAERWRMATPPRALKPWQLAAYYRVKGLVPRSVRHEARRRLMRRQGASEFPAWPLDCSVERLLRFAGACLLAAAATDELQFRWFWPHPYRFAVILTHDVESAEGLRLAVEVADLEESRGLRSSFNVVAGDYRVDDGILSELRSRGFEIGVHGIHHDRSMFASRASFEAQMPDVRRAAERFGAEGFRSPATHRVFDWLADLPLSYDCTIPNSDPYEAIPGGCCSPWPFFIGNVVELPYTLSQDHTVFTLLRHRSLDLWTTQLEALSRCGGLVQVLSHPDPGYLGDADKRRLYAEFLDLLRGHDDAWMPLPRDAAAWWRDRDRGSSERWTMTEGTIRQDDSETGALLAPPSHAGPRESRA